MTPPACDAAACGGTARDGDVTLAGTETINVCQALDSGVGALLSPVGGRDGAFAVGRLVLVHQVQESFAVVGSATPVADAAGAGTFEVTRITAMGAGGITVEPPLAFSYGSGATRSAQVCVVPEYDSLNITGTVVAQPWNGSRGGVVAFYARTMNLTGSVVATAAGFRGGLSNTVSDISIQNVTGLDLNGAGPEAAGKGESTDITAFTRGGRGNLAHGGGGGNAKNAGGGGGGNGGAGGLGGKESSGTTNTMDDELTRGLGGAPWSDTVGVLDAVAFGGGGGGGHQDSMAPGPGGAGGGVVMVLAATVTGSGTLVANGADGATSAVVGNTSDAGGGGGAGGTVVLWSNSDVPATVVVAAQGGQGGDVGIPMGSFTKRGPGGGGGGGRVLVRAGNTVASDVSGGLAGENLSDPTDPWSATPGAEGQVQTP